MSVYLLIDCGTTNLRVTLLGEDRDVLGVRREEGGVRHTAIDGHNGRLRRSLRDCIQSLLTEHGLTPGDVGRCVAYGMITSNMGLLEIPHLPAPVTAADLRAAMREEVFEDIAPFPIAFIPGVRNFSGDVNLDNFGAMDMMRGEETEAVGLHALLAPEGEAVFILPGSHNKFVRMGAKGEILGCMTSISGELLDALTHHTILADSVNRGFVSEADYDPAMAREGAWACAHSGLGCAAFAGRILSTLGGKGAADVQSYLLGAVLALDAAALESFLPDACGARVYVAGKAPVQRAMCDVLDALGVEGARAVKPELTAKMGVTGAGIIGM